MMRRRVRRPLALVVCVLLLFSCLTALLPRYTAAAVYSGEQELPADCLIKDFAGHPNVTAEKGSFSVKATVENFSVKLIVTASGLENTPINAAVMDFKSFTGGTLLGEVTNFTDSTRFETPANAGLADSGDYRYNVGETFLGDGAELEISGWNIPAGSGSSPALKPIVLKNTVSADLATDGDNGNTFYRSYVFVVSSATIGGAAASNFAVGAFLMDAAGNMLESSYLVRYIKNQSANDKTTAVTDKVEPQITKWADPTALRAEKYTRMGYEFKGWDTDPELYKSWRVDGESAAGDRKYVYRPWEEITEQPDYQPGEALNPGDVPNPGSAKEYGMTDLYAAWYPVQVAFANSAETLPTTEEKPLQVGVAYEQKYDLAKTSCKDTEKTYQVMDKKKLPEGLKVQADGKLGWKVVGTPQVYTEADTVLTLRVTDKSNGTWDELTLTLPPIRKGAQLRPDLDVNTGLETDVRETVPEEGGEALRDGVLFGLYSLGQQAPNADGTGSLRDYYLSTNGQWNELLLYEYRPKGEPNAPWREVPLPKAYYAEAQLELLAPSMGKGAVPVVSTTAAVKDKAVTVTAEEQTMPEGWTGWPENYGFIAFDESGTPELHGLTEGAVYEVRFRENSDYAPSETVELTISAGGGGGGGAADPSECRTVVFYDWDGTLLGTRIVAVGGSITDAPEPDPEKLLVDMDKDGVFDEEDGDIKDLREGYLFAGWVDYYEGESTPTAENNSAPGLTQPTEGTGSLISLENITENLVLKAAYNEDATKIAALPFLRKYTITYSEVRNSKQGLEITFYVKRPQVARRGNHGDVYLQVGIAAKGASPTFLKTELDPNDYTKVDVIVPYYAQAELDENKAVLAEVVDADGNSLSNQLSIKADYFMPPT